MGKGSLGGGKAQPFFLSSSLPGSLTGFVHHEQKTSPPRGPNYYEELGIKIFLLKIKKGEGENCSPSGGVVVFVFVLLAVNGGPVFNYDTYLRIGPPFFILGWTYLSCILL